MAIPRGAREAIARAAAELATVAPFSELAPTDRARLAAALEEVAYAPGEVIFAQGTLPDALYILREGTVERQRNGVRLELLQPPAVFGDLGLLRNEVRATTLLATTPARLWRLPGDRFVRIVAHTPHLATFFASTLGGQLALRMQQVAELSQEVEDMAEHLYASLDPAEQQTLERAALLPRLDERVLGEPPRSLPLAEAFLDKDAGATAYPSAFRRFLEKRTLERLGEHGLADTRRRLAARAHEIGDEDLSVQILLEGGLAPEAVALPADVDAEIPAAELSFAAWRPGRRTTALGLGVLLLAAGWALPVPAGLGDRGWHALVTIAASLPLLAVEALPDGIVALLLASAWVVGGVTAPRIALGGFATTQWVLVVSTLAVGAAIASSGLLYRMALWVVAKSRGGYAGQVVGLGIAGMLIGPAAPNATSRVALVAPAVTELVDALGLRPGGPRSIGLAMAVLIGFGQVVALFLTSSTTSVLVYAVLPEATRASVSWGTWFLRSLPTHVVLVGLLMAFILWRYGSVEESSDGSSNSLALQRALLGPPSRHERIAMAVTVFLLLGFSTQPLHHVDPAWIGVVALAVLAGSGVLSANGLSAVNWSFALLSGILTGMSDVFADTQLDKWLAGIATELIGGLSSTPVAFVAALTLLCFALSVVMRWQAAAPLLTISLAPVALSSGIDPWLVGLIALMACNGFFLPYQSTTYLALYHGTGGRLFTHRQARPIALAFGVATLVALCASVPVWRAMGLLS